jgi:hypothetical protein
MIATLVQKIDVDNTIVMHKPGDIFKMFTPGRGESLFKVLYLIEYESDTWSNRYVCMCLDMEKQTASRYSFFLSYKDKD